MKLPSHVATLPVTEAAARATPLTPAQWQAMLPQEHVASPSVPSERPAPGEKHIWHCPQTLARLSRVRGLPVW